MHFWGWKAGLKTGMYYLRTRPAAQAIQFTVDASVLNDVKKANAVASEALAATTKTVTPAPPAEVAIAKVNGVVANGAKTSTLPPVTASGIDVSLEKMKLIDSPLLPPSQDIPSTPPVDPKVAKAAAEDPEFAAALKRQKDREYEQEKLMCSIANKEACVMCSG